MFIETFHGELLNLDHVVVIDTEDIEVGSLKHYSGVYAFYDYTKERGKAIPIVSEEFFSLPGWFKDEVTIDDLIMAMRGVIKDLICTRTGGVIRCREMLASFESECRDMLRNPK